MSAPKKGDRCISSAYYAEQFPAAIKRNGGKRLEGVILNASRRYPECFRVKWDSYKTPLTIHRKFFTVAAEGTAS